MGEGGTVDAAPARKNAGGQATEAGMAFQADLGTWIAAHILAQLPLGGRFGIDQPQRTSLPPPKDERTTGIGARRHGR